MKVLSVRSARSVWLFPLLDLNPTGRQIWREVISGLQVRYGFLIAPNYKEILEARLKNQPQSWAFSGGSFRTRKGKGIDIAVTIHRDGLWADSASSTSEADEFASDMLSWLHTEHGLLDHRSLPISRAYVSELNVSFDKPLTLLNPKFTVFCRALSERIPSTIKNPQYELASVGFWIDPAQRAQHVHFRIERDEGMPFELNRYYAVAPLQTDIHVEMLETFEAAIAT